MISRVKLNFGLAMLILVLVMAACGQADSNQDSIQNVNTVQANDSSNAGMPDNTEPEQAQPLVNQPSESSGESGSEADWVPSGPLSTGGPWYVVSNREGLYAFNMDGTGLTLLTRETLGSYVLSNAGVSSSGGRFAYLTTVDGYQDAKLHIVDITDNLSHTEISLFSNDEVETDASRAVVEQPSYAWSHQGNLLAFFGVIDGPSSDLYVYNTADRKITRLTSGPSQGYQPSWSPEDKYIAHSGANSFGTGAGYDMAGLWAAAADDSGVFNLPMPADSADEIILGWRDNDTFLSYTWGPGPGPHNLRFTNLYAAYAQEVWEWPFSMAVMSKGSDGRILVGVDDYPAPDNPIYGEGLYALDPPDYQPVLLFEGETGFLRQRDAGIFVYVGDTTYIVEGKDFNDISSWEGELIISINGTFAGYSYNGLWVSLNGEIENLFSHPVQHAAWGAEGQSILFSTEEDLWVVTAPEWDPILVAAAFFADEIVLVLP